MLFGISVGGSSGSNRGKSTTDSTIKKGTTTTSEKTGTSSTSGTQEQTTIQLDQETQNLLAGLIEEAGGDVGTTSEELNKFAQDLISRSGETEQILTENIAGILDEARRSGEKEIGQLQTSLSTAAGSSQNTFVAGATAEAVAQLESQLAAKEGELNIAARQAGTQDLFSSFQALAAVPGAKGQETANVANLVNALKGATTTTSSVADQATTSDESLTAFEDILQTIHSFTKSKGNVSQSNAGFQFGI